jgi:hypothetical protein
MGKTIPPEKNIVGLRLKLSTPSMVYRIGNQSCNCGMTFVFLSSSCHELLGSCAPTGQTMPAQRNALGLPSPHTTPKP